MLKLELRDHSLRTLAIGVWIAILLAGSLFGQASVLTWHNDNARTGQNLQETILTPANVNAASFGKKFVISVDGKVDAQPIYVPAVQIPGQGSHNVLYVVTEHDSAYVFDADTGVQLWKVSLLGANETTSDSRGCGQVTPEIGITSTPAIDLQIGPHGTIYMVAMSKDSNGAYHHRLHALDLTTGGEQFSGPVEVQATASGTGSGSSNGTLTFDAKQYKDRAGLLIVNGVVYTSWASHCDISPYTSWVIGYNATNLQRVSVLNLVPNGNLGAIWAAGSGPAADANGNIYVQTGNGTFDTTLTAGGFPNKNDYGNAMVKMSTSGGLSVVDYFTMFNTASESGSDADLGSGGLMLLPPLTKAGGGSVSLAVGAGKDGHVYVVDQANMGKFHSAGDVIYQKMSTVVPGGVWSSPAWFNGKLYYGDVGGTLKAFTFSNGFFDTVPSSHSTNTFPYPGTTPSISASGTSNGIVWAAENAGTAVLHAYDASDLSHELYNSNQAANSRDHFGAGNKYIVPTIANGKVYAGTTNGVGVFGLSTTVTADSVTPGSGSGATQTFALQYSDTAGAANMQTAWVWFNAAFSSTNNSCFLYYDRAANQLNLAPDTTGPYLMATPGTVGMLQNGQCAVNMAATSVVLNGNTLTLNLAMTFKPAFSGAKSIFMYGRDVSLTNSGWQTRGSWTVPAPAAVVTADSVTPGSGSGAIQTFALQYSDSNGAANFQTAWVWFNAAFSSTSNSCFLYYDRAANKLNLAPDTTGSYLVATPGTVGTLQNSQCAVNMAATSVVLNGNTLTLNLAMTFKPAFGGAKNIYMYGRDVSLTNSGWQTRGTWTVPAGVAVVTADSVTPGSGTGATQSFALQYSDSNGAASFQTAWVWFNAAFSSTANSCFLYYDRAANQLNLAPDTTVSYLVGTPGTAGTLQNSQCSVNMAATSVVLNGNTLTLNLAMTFKPAFSGAKSIFMYGRDVSLTNSGWQTRGTWMVP